MGKICIRCSRDLPADHCHYFKKSTQIDRLTPSCKECMGYKFSQPRGAPGYRRCSKCGEEKPETTDYFLKHIGGRGGLRPYCRTCGAENGKQWGKNNADRAIANSKKWYANNKERVRLYQKVNRKHIAEVEKLWRENNPEVRAATREKWMINNPDRDKLWRKNNPNTVVMITQRRRAKKLELPNTLTPQEWRTVKQYFNNKCAYCGKESKLTQEHFVALSKNGEFTHNNIICVCGACNSSKGDRDFFEWYPKQGFYGKTRERYILKFLNYISRTQQLSISMQQNMGGFGQ